MTRPGRTRGGPDAERRFSLRGVVATALGTYRRRFVRVAVAALIIVGPMDVLVTLLTAAGETPTDQGALSLSLRIATGAADFAGTVLALTFFAGVLDRVVAVDQHGAEDAPLGRIIRELPFTRLVVADFVSTLLVLAGLLAFIVPGIVLAVLWSILGPLIIIEDLRLWPALRRSAGLVWPRFFTVFVLVVVPALLEEWLTSALEHFHVYEHVALMLTADVAVTVIVSSFVGLLEVTLAHELIADQRARRAKRATPDTPDGQIAAEAPPPSAAAKLQSRAAASDNMG